MKVMRWVKGFPGHHSALNSFGFSCFSGNAKHYAKQNSCLPFAKE